MEEDEDADVDCGVSGSILSTRRKREWCWWRRQGEMRLRVQEGALGLVLLEARPGVLCDAIVTRGARDCTEKEDNEEGPRWAGSWAARR